MIWSILAGGTAVFYALHGAWSVWVSRRVGSLPAGWALFAFALPFLTLNLWWRGIPTVEASFWGVWMLTGLLNLGAWSLFFSALRSGDLGVTYPLLALTPLMVLPVEWVLTGDLPAPGGAAGIALIVSGVYLLNYRKEQRSAFDPLRALFQDAGARKAVAVAALWSVAGTLDRLAVARSSPAFYSFMFVAGQSVLFVPLLVWAMRRPEEERADGNGSAGGGPDHPLPDPSRRSPRGFGETFGPAGAWALLLHGMLFAGMLILQMEALRLALASYVLSIKRSGAILAVLIGYFAYGEEALGPRLVGTVVTLLGMLVLVLLG